MSTTIVGIILVIVVVAAGGVIVYYKGNTKLQKKVADFILEAEKMYTDLTKAGGLRFEWVVDQLYGLLPAAIKPFVPRTWVAGIVQNTFNIMKQFAQLQLNKLTNKITG